MLSAGNVTTTMVRPPRGRDRRSQTYLPFFLERYPQAYGPNWRPSPSPSAQERPPHHFADGVSALVLANAAAESAVTGKTVAITA